MTDALYQWEHVGAVALVEILPGEIRQPAEAVELGNQLRYLLAGGERKILLDCNRVSYMASTGFAVLLSFAKAAQEEGGEVRIAALHPDVRIGAGIIRLGEIIPIHDDRASAITAFGTQ
jgi:anti-anti-sigma factor